MNAAIATPVTKKRATSVGGYLIDRLYDLGVRHVFGVPGDYILQFYGILADSPIKLIGTTREDCAAFAADAYARVGGLGAVCVTYCVGGLNICNPIAGAYAERSPVVVISGAPGMGERTDNPLLHHKVRDFSTQRDVFDHLTAATAELNDPITAYGKIDRVLDIAITQKRPVYLELPRDLVGAESFIDDMPRCDGRSDSFALSEATNESVAMINSSRKPVILAGVEIHRFGLQRELLKLAEGSGIPIASTLLGKSVVSERHPLYMGVYAAAFGREDVRQYVESSDCLITLGTYLTDIDLGIASPVIDPANCIHATSEQLQIRHHHFHDVLLCDFVAALAAAPLQAWQNVTGLNRVTTEWRPTLSAKLTVKRLFDCLASFLTDDMVVIADIGDALIGAIDLPIHRQTEFLSPAYYTTMGFAVPAALGAQFASKSLRPLVVVGDGAFQMTGMELSTIARHGLNPIILVLNNQGYGTERLLLPGLFNDIHNWDYHKIPEVLRAGWGCEVHTEDELDRALHAALNNRSSFSILNVHLDENDRSEALDRLAARLAEKVTPNRKGIK